MKKILFALVVLTASLQLMAIPARPGRFTVTQPDGTRLVLQRHGDEWGHWLTDVSGRMVVQDEDGYYRPARGITVDEIRRNAAARRALANQRRAARRAAETGPVAIGRKHFLVILVEFTNKHFSTSDDPKAAFTALLNEEGYSVNGGTGSARDYYYDNSHGLFEPVFDVYGPVRMDTTYAYYGANNSRGDDLRPEEAVIDGCRKLDEEIDFTRYDNDGDGKVDLVFMYYAGKGEADGGASNTIWPHQWEISSAGKSLELDGMVIDSYACTNEVTNNRMCGIGTACHEFAHAMGLPDFYDTDYEDNGMSAGLFSFSTMDGGAYNNSGRTPPYFNIEERMMLGWLDRDVLREFPETGSFALLPMHENVAYMTPTDQDGEYFVYECRNAEGWDSALPAHGLLIYHVDRSDRKLKVYGSRVTARDLWDHWSDLNGINENGSHPCFYIVPAPDPENLLFGHSLWAGSYYFDESYAPQIPFPGSKAVTRFIPKSWNGVEGDITFRDIDYAGGVVTLKARVFTGEVDYPTIADAGAYRAGDRFTFSLVPSDAEEAPSSVAWFFDDEPVQADSVTLTAGEHVVEASLTYADGWKRVLTLEITAN